MQLAAELELNRFYLPLNIWYYTNWAQSANLSNTKISLKNYHDCRESNLGVLGEKREVYLCAVQPLIILILCFSGVRRHSTKRHGGNVTGRQKRRRRVTPGRRCQRSGQGRGKRCVNDVTWWRHWCDGGGDADLENDDVGFIQASASWRGELLLSYWCWKMSVVTKAQGPVL